MSILKFKFNKGRQIQITIKQSDFKNFPNTKLFGNNYFLCPNLEKRVALFVGSVKSTFPFLFGSETSKKREKKLVKAYDFRAKRENHVFTRFFSRFLQVSDPK